MDRLPLIPLFLGLLLLAGTSALGAQAGSPDSRGLEITRSELEKVVQRLEEVSRSSAYSSELRNRARTEAALARERLEIGDFQIGDQIELIVEGEPQLAGTLTVSNGPALRMPEIGEIPLSGVLRSEVTAHLSSELGRYLVNPRVQARSLFRVTVVGAVVRPGFYIVAADALLTDAIMLAGGFSGSAEITKIRIERSSRPIWDGDVLQTAIAEGRTLDQLSLRSGDHIVVPMPAARRNTLNSVRVAAMLISPAIVIIQLLQNVF